MLKSEKNTFILITFFLFYRSESDGTQTKIIMAFIVAITIANILLVFVIYTLARKKHKLCFSYSSNIEEVNTRNTENDDGVRQLSLLIN